MDPELVTCTPHAVAARGHAFIGFTLYIAAGNTGLLPAVLDDHSIAAEIVSV